jgi:hypothetical protein
MHEPFALAFADKTKITPAVDAMGESLCTDECSRRDVIVFALDTDDFLFAAIIYDQSSELASLDAASVQAFRVFLDIETTLRIMPIDSYGALGRRMGV